MGLSVIIYGTETETDRDEVGGSLPKCERGVLTVGFVWVGASSHVTAVYG